LLRHELAAEHAVLIGLLHAVTPLILGLVLCRRVCSNTCGSCRDDRRSSTERQYLTFKHVITPELENNRLRRQPCKLPIGNIETCGLVVIDICQPTSVTNRKDRNPCSEKTADATALVLFSAMHARPAAKRAIG
jgi:hypothetical protein